MVLGQDTELSNCPVPWTAVGKRVPFCNACTPEQLEAMATGLARKYPEIDTVQCWPTQDYSEYNCNATTCSAAAFAQREHDRDMARRVRVTRHAPNAAKCTLVASAHGLPEREPKLRDFAYESDGNLFLITRIFTEDQMSDPDGFPLRFVDGEAYNCPNIPIIIRNP